MQKNSQRAPMTFGKFSILFSGIIYASVIACTVSLGFASPVRNWDMLAYIGAAASIDTKDPVKIHTRVFDEVKPHAPAWLFEDYRKNALSKEPDIFNRQLVFYQIKPLYVRSIWLLNKAGLGMAPATWGISAVAFALLGLALALWRPQKANYALWLLSLCALILTGNEPMGMLAGYSTPDCLSLMLLISGFIAWFRYRSALVYTLCMGLAVFTRPDALLQALALTFYFTFFISKERRFPLGTAAIAACVPAAAYLIIQLTVKGAPNWSTIFYSGFINITYDFTRHPVTITWEQYQRALLWGLQHEVRDLRMLFFAALSILAAALHFSRPGQRHDWLWLLLMAWGTLVLRFLLFPHWGDERYYYYYYIFMLMACLEMFAAFKASPSSSAPA